LIARYGIERVAEGAVFRLTFGIEDSLRIKRVVLEEVKRDAGLFNTRKRFSYAYRFELQNFGKGGTEVELWETLPVSELDDVTVSVATEKTTAGYKLDASGRHREVAREAVRARAEERRAHVQGRSAEQLRPGGAVTQTRRIVTPGSRAASRWRSSGSCVAMTAGPSTAAVATTNGIDRVPRVEPNAVEQRTRFLADRSVEIDDADSPCEHAIHGGVSRTTATDLGQHCAGTRIGMSRSRATCKTARARIASDSRRCAAARALNASASRIRISAIGGALVEHVVRLPAVGVIELGEQLGESLALRARDESRGWQNGRPTRTHAPPQLASESARNADRQFFDGGAHNAILLE